jgi:hypothetical protein
MHHWQPAAECKQFKLARNKKQGKVKQSRRVSALNNPFLLLNVKPEFIKTDTIIH